MSKESLEDIKKLPPKERIKRLKELQEKNKKEIEEAKDLIKNSEEDQVREDMLNKVPLPKEDEVSIDDFLKGEDDIDASKETEYKKDYNEKLELENSIRQGQNAQYHMLENQRTIDELKGDLYNIQDQIYNNGQINEEQKQEIYKIGKELYEKRNAMTEGNYSADDQAKKEMDRIESKQKSLYSMLR